MSKLPKGKSPNNLLKEKLELERKRKIDKNINEMIATAINDDRSEVFDNSRNSHFRRNAITTQTAAVITKAFTNAANEKSLNRWKLLLQ